MFYVGTYTSRQGDISKYLFSPLFIGTYSVNSNDILRKGAYGVVFTAMDARGNKAAEKRLDGKDKHKMLKITKDLDVLLTLDHPNIVKVLDIHQVDTTI